MSNWPVYITAGEAICALGNSLAESLDQWGRGKTGLTREEGLLAGRIQDRSLLKGRRYGAASNLAVVVARRAVERAGWDLKECGDVWLFAASSRGNAGELLNAHTWRRGSQRFRASNTLHSEIAAAVSIELGLTGPWQMIANGCSGGLDALGMAWMAIRSGVAKRALVVSVDLPLAPQLLKDFEETRLLSLKGYNDPLSPETDGFIPGEAAAAITLDVVQHGSICEVASYAANSDAYDSLAVPATGAPLADLIGKVCGHETPDVICPHATGTANHAAGEVAALRRAFPQEMPPVLLLKPFTGHTLAASGLLDVALMAGSWQKDGLMRTNYRVTMPEGFSRMVRPRSKSCLKIASGMGGHNAALLLRRIS